VIDENILGSKYQPAYMNEGLDIKRTIITQKRQQIQRCKVA
ncbi:unnamed protein product, partial [Acidithrix sp. C25]